MLQLQYRSLAVLAVLGAFTVLSACADDETQKPKAKQPPAIVAFETDRDAIYAGESVKLSWQTEGATRLELRDSYGYRYDLGNRATRPAVGSIEMRPTASETYELTAIGPGGSATAAVSVVVDELPPRPQIVSFTATPNPVGKGAPVVLAWQTQGADTISIENSRGVLLDLGDAGVAQGELELRLDNDETFILRAENLAGRSSSTVVVDTVTLPVVRFDGPADPLNPGVAARLFYNVQNANHVVIKDESGNVIEELTTGFNGFLEVRPDITTRYILTATNAAGSIDSDLTVLVRPTIRRFEALTEIEVRGGEPIELVWETAGVTRAAITTLGGERYEVPQEDLESGTVTLPVGRDGVFEFIAWGGPLEVRQTAGVPATHAPLIRSFEADASIVSARPDLPARIRLSWLVDGARSLQLVAEPGGPIDIRPLSQRADSVEVELIESTVYTLVAENNTGSRQAQASVEVVAAPRIVSFEAYPSRVGVNEEVKLVWETEDAVEVRLERDGVDVGVEPTLVDGSFSETLVTDATYVLRAFNDEGFEIHTSELVVSVGEPEIVSFTADPSPASAGQTVTLAWENRGGAELAIVDEDGIVVCSATAPEAIASGSCQTVVSIDDGTHPYTLRLTNASGTVEQVLPLRVLGGPIVRDFIVSTPSLTVGETVEVSWSVTDDAKGNKPQLELRDDLGTIYPIPDDVDVNEGSLVLAPEAIGAKKLTLTASSPDTTPGVVERPLAVWGVPSVGPITFNPERADTDINDGLTLLSWKAEHAVSLVVERLDEDGDPVERLPVPTDGTQLEEGSYAFAPPVGGTTYRITVTNGDGETASGEATVLVNAAEFLTFEADVEDIVAGEAATLSWTTRRADQVTIDNAPFSVREVDGGFVDIAVPGQELELDGNTHSVMYADITFPFPFPFFGNEQESGRALADGFFSFTPHATSTSATQPLPSVLRNVVQIAAFWNDLAVGSGSNARGKMYAKHDVDAESEKYIVQWSDFLFGTENGSEATFQIVFRPSGKFEIHYGRMHNEANLRSQGDPVTIGVQNPSGTVGQMIHRNTIANRPFSGRGYVFEPSPFPAQGQISVMPAETVEYTLVADNGYSTDERTVEIRVHAPVRVMDARIKAEELVVGKEFPVEWTVRNAKRVEVRDVADNVLCTVEETEAVAEQSGFCWATLTHAGEQPVFVRAVGGLERDEFILELDANVTTPLEIEELSLDKALVEPNTGGTTLRWQTSGPVSSWSLTAEDVDGSEVIDVTGLSAAAGQLAVNPSITTTYTLRIENDHGVVREESIRLDVRTAYMGNLEVTGSQVVPGHGAVISWTSASGVVSIEGYTPYEEVSEPYEDISDLPGTQTLTMSSDSASGYADLTLPFTLQWYGEQLTTLRVRNGGGMGDQLDKTTWNTGGQKFPTSYQPVIAPFWYSMKRVAASGSKVVWRQGSDTRGDYVIVQWHKMQPTSGTGEFNFQAVIRPSGEVTYRYGHMQHSTYGYAAGLNASVGQQNTARDQGINLVFKNVYPGGLANRSFRPRIELPSSGTTVVYPEKTTNVEVCVSNLGYTECKDVLVVVVQVGDLAITEIMLAPNGTQENQWFEVLNKAPYPIDLGGFKIYTPNDDPGYIVPGSLVLNTGEYASFARSANPGFTPDRVYGEAITLDLITQSGTNDKLMLELDNLLVDDVINGPTWTWAQGRASQLSPAFYTLNESDNDYDKFGSGSTARIMWCDAEHSYDGLNYGTPGQPNFWCEPTEHYSIDPFGIGDAFIDISEMKGVDVLLDASSHEDTVERYFPGIGFAFPFFGETKTDLYVSSNGWLSFAPFTGTTSDYAPAPPLPLTSTSYPRDAVFGFWYDLQLQADDSQRIYTTLLTVGSDKVRIVQWQGWKAGSSSGHMTFQLQLWSDGRIVFAVGDMSSRGGYYGGSSATLGMQNSDATKGVSWTTPSNRGYRAWEGQVLTYRPLPPPAP